jgi:hypothetical protein
MYRFKSDHGFLLFPYPGETFFSETYIIKDTAGRLEKFGLAIPEKADDFADFQVKMEIAEGELSKELKKLLN